MRRTSLLFLMAALACALFMLAACSIAPEAEEVTVQVTPVTADQLKIFGTLPEAAPAADFERTEELINLGRMLYYEPRMSTAANM